MHATHCPAVAPHLEKSPADRAALMSSRPGASWLPPGETCPADEEASPVASMVGIEDS